MVEFVSAILRHVIGPLWWDDLPDRVGESGVFLTVLSFLGRASSLGLLCEDRADVPTYALNGCCAFGVVALFVVAATFFIDPDRLS